MKEGRSRSSRYHSYCDDYYVNMNLNTEMELPHSRETVLHFFEQVKKNYPGMKNFYSRERGEFVLEEDKDKGDYRWTSIENAAGLLGIRQPATVEEAMKQHALVLDMIPYCPLDQPARLRVAERDVRLRLHLSRQPQPAAGRCPGRACRRSRR